MICIFFCICSFAGSVYAALALSVISVIIWLVRSQKFAVIFPFLIFAIFVWILYTHYNELILFSRNTNGGYDFLDKTNSANMRFGYIRDFLPKIITSPFGLDEEIFQPLGFIVRSAARSGYIGGILATMVLVKLYAIIGLAITKGQLSYLQKFGLLIVYGALIAGFIYLDNCFIQIYGFTLLVLIYQRVQKLSITK